MLTFEIFFAFWQKVSPHLTIEAGDEASNIEWEGKDSYGNDCKFQGTRNAGGAKQGIVRTTNRHGISEDTYCNDKLHGLCFTW